MSALAAEQPTQPAGLEIDESLLDAGLTLINAASTLDAAEVKRLLKEEEVPAWFQDELGWSALHYAAEREDEEMVKVLLANGAVWNSVDNLGNSPACIALSLNSARIYDLIKSHGVRSEFLLGFLEAKAEDPSSDSNLVLKDAEEETLAGNTALFLKSKLTYSRDEQGQERVIDEEGNGVMMGWETGVSSSALSTRLTNRADTDFSHVFFLGLALVDYGGDCRSLDGGLSGRGQGAAEDLERGLRSGHREFQIAAVIHNDTIELTAVDVQIDSMFSNVSPSPVLHTVIEPHPSVLAHMEETGWTTEQKPNLMVLKGKWQEFMESEEIYKEGGYDLIYFDTFSEGYGGALLSFVCPPQEKDATLTTVVSPSTHDPSQSSRPSSNTCPTSWPGLNRASASSMVSERRRLRSMTRTRRCRRCTFERSVWRRANGMTCLSGTRFERRFGTAFDESASLLCFTRSE